MKIGIDCRLWNETGVGRYTRNLVLELAKIDTQNQYVLFLRKKDFDTVDIPGKNFEKKLAEIQWHSVSEQLFFSRILGRENLDLVHFPYFSVPLFYHLPFVVTIHDLIPFHFSTGKASTLPAPVYSLKRLGYKLVISLAIKKAKKIITVSDVTKKDIEKSFGISPSSILVTHEGYDDALNDSSKKTYINGSYFLYVGNAYPHKNLDTLVEAFTKLLEERRDVSLVLVGKEDYFYKQLKQRIIKSSLQDNILIYGYATDEELTSLYKNAIAFVYPSLMEGFGLPLLEAMYNKCLIVASDIPVFREIAGDVPLYFNPKDVEDIKKTMDSVLEKGKGNFSSNIQKGLVRVKQFSWTEMAKKTLDVYNSSV